MDFGGRKAVATAAGLFDGASISQAVRWPEKRLASCCCATRHRVFTAMSLKSGRLCSAHFAVLGALIISRLWNALPGRGGHGAPIAKERWAYLSTDCELAGGAATVVTRSTPSCGGFGDKRRSPIGLAFVGDVARHQRKRHRVGRRQCALRREHRLANRRLVVDVQVKRHRLLGHPEQ